MSESIRNLLFGIEAVAYTEAATFEAVRPISFKIDSKDVREPVIEENATLNDEEDVTSGPVHTEIDLSVEIYFDQIGLWLTMLCGAPVTTTDIGSAVGANQHVWKRNTALPKTASIKWNDGVAWRKVKGAVINTAEFVQAAEKRVRLNLKLLSFPESEISAPTIPAFAYAAYNHPVASILQVFKVAGSTSAVLLSGKWNFNNNRKAKWSTQASAAPNKFKQGKFKQTADLMADFAAYSGSFYESMKTNAAIGSVELKFTDTGSSIGTGTPTNPSFSMLFPKTKAMDDGRDFSKEDVEQSVKLLGQPDATTSSAATFTVVNEKAASAYAGS